MHPSRRPSLCIVHSAFCIALALATASATASLPAGYRRTEYTASNGSQSLETGIVPKSTTRVVCIFRFRTVSSSEFLCGWGSTGNKEAILFGANATEFRASVSKSWAWKSTGVAPDTNPHVFDLSNDAMKFDGQTLGTGDITSTATANQTMWLFAIHAEWQTAAHCFCDMEIYSCQIYDGDTLVCDLIPARRESDGVAGLYDLVNDVFRTSRESTPLIAGPDAGPGFALPGRLDIAASPQAYGEPTPSYGIHLGLEAGESRPVSCPASFAESAESVVFACTGWKLYDALDNVVSNGVGNAFTYVHPSPAAYRRLEWQWNELLPRLAPADVAASYTTASLSTLLAAEGAGASSTTVSFAYGTDAENLPAPSVIANGLAAGQTATANLTGLSTNTTYHYAFTVVNNASPAQSYTMTGSFTTRAYGAPEIAVRATPGLVTSTIAVTVKTPGTGVATCDVFVAMGDDPANLGAEEQLGDDVGIGAVCAKSIASPTTPYLKYWAVRVVNAEGLSATATGTLDTEIKWYFDSKNKRLTNAAGWKVAASLKTVNGVQGYNLDGADCIQVAPEDGGGNYLTELDLTGLKDTGLDIISLGANIFRSNGGLKIPLTKLHLPDTIMKTESPAFITTGTITDFEPHDFPNLVSHSKAGLPTSLFANPVVSFPNPGYTTLPQQMWQGTGAKAIYFGYGLTKFEDYAIDNKGPTDIYLTGDAVPTTGTGWTRQINGSSPATTAIRINVPIYSDEWKAYAAASAADPTSSQQTTYDDNFTDGRPLWKVGKSSQTPNYGGIYLAKWAPDDYCRNALHVRGNIPAGVVSPAYGKNKYIPQTSTVSAPAAATYEGVDYVCSGYVIEALGSDGWGAPVTNLNVNSFTLNRDGETSYRITWLWDVAGYAITVPDPDSGVIGETVFSPAIPASGSYPPGTQVTVTPVLGDGWTGAFDHWEGDVPAGCETNNPLVVTMDQARTLVPVFATEWVAVDGYATTRITDGYFTIKISTSNGEITTSMDCMNGVTQPKPTETLDLRKPVADGRTIVAVGGYSFVPSRGSATVYDLRLPDTLRSIGEYAFQGQPLRHIEPYFHDNVTSFGTGIFGAATTTQPVYFMGLGHTTAPNVFGTKFYHGTFYYGLNMAAFASWHLDTRNGAPAKFDLHFTGDIVPTTASNWRSSTSIPMRANVPIYSEAWKAYLVESADDPTEAQRTSYTANFTDGRELWKVGKSGQSPDYGGVYFCKWSPEIYCSNAVWVAANIEMGEVSPPYGVNTSATQSVACSAPATAEHDGGDYVCAGYVLETMGADGWGVPVTNLNVNSFTLNRDGDTSYRVTWLWAEAGFKLFLNTSPAYPPSGLTYGEIAVSPAGNAGNYAPGTVVTLTAPATGNGDWTDAVFDHWIGDVPSGHEKDNPLVVTMDQARSLTPFYKANWRAVDGYETTRITDGYFTLKCTTANGEITLPYSCGVVTGGVAVLDLRKPVADGRIITTFTGYTFSPNSGSTMFPFETFVFPDTVTKISTQSVGGGMFGHTGVKRILNTFPNSLTNFTGAISGLSQNWEGGPVYLLNKTLSSIPGQMFSSWSGGHTYHLGVGITSIPNYCFDAISGGGNLSVYLHGETKPTFGGSDWHRSASPVRLVVPRSSSEWKAWIAAGNTTAPTAAQTNTYNTTFADREPGERLVGICKNVDRLNGVYLCTWPSPEASTRKTVIFLK